MFMKRLFWILLTILLLPDAWGCACGCGIFNLAVPGLPNSYHPDILSLQYSRMNQDETDQGERHASGQLNPDKQIDTGFFNLTAQHRFTRSWSMMLMIPVWKRHFVTDVQGSVGFLDPSPMIESTDVTALSDLRVTAIYSGFSEDMSQGIEFGFKLPTGSTHAGARYQGSPLLDRDTQPGTGTTDALMGGYWVGNWSTSGWFMQALYRRALNRYEGYRPGDSLNASLGIHEDAWLTTTHLMPMLQINAQWRSHDQGGGDAQYQNANSGYNNLFLTPGLQANLSDHWMANAMLYIPLQRHVHGFQQVAALLWNVGISRFF